MYSNLPNNMVSVAGFFEKTNVNSPYTFHHIIAFNCSS